MNNTEEFQTFSEVLDLFTDGVIWKTYFGRHVKPYVRGRVLEVGAGIAGTTPYIRPEENVTSWTCLEPDDNMAQTIKEKVVSGKLSSDIIVLTSDIHSLERNDKYDSILYIDVLEHIDDDRGEIQNAMKHLAPDGRIIVVSPAHNWLYTPFDKAVGHFRRYNKKSLRRAIPEGLKEEKVFYLDSVGLFASMANRFFLKQSMPTEGQLKIWDKVLVPLSKIGDPLLGYFIGKQIIGVWRISS